MSTKLTKRQRRQLRKEGVLNLVDSHNNGIYLKTVSAKTPNQQEIFDRFDSNHLFVHGWPGTGKTYVLMYLALKRILGNSPYTKLKIFRSAVSTRNMGFLPGSVVAKMESFETPYHDIVSDLMGRDDGYGICKHKGLIEFLPTSYIRGATYNDCIVLVDECQNLNWHEFSSIMTRAGTNCKLIFCGDSHQSDLRSNDKLDIHKMIDVCDNMPSFDLINMEIDDIIRSGLVKEFILTANELNYRF